jgi:glycosyltransferase involved in cell wall biosynthesis
VNAAADVSVVIPARNAEATIARAIASALRQTAPPREIIVIDDASIDGTAACAAAAGGGMVRVIALPARLGAAGARNAGIAAARGAFIAFLDADDSWDVEKTARQMAVMAVHPAMTFCACRARHVGEDGTAIGPIHGGVPVATGAEAWRSLLAENFVATPCVMARRESILAVGGFDASLPVAEDQDLWIRLAIAGEVGFVDAVLVTVQDRPGSLSREYAERTAAVTLAMVLGHIERHQARLTRAERRHALGARYTQNGRRFYRGGAWREGLRCLMLAMANGHAVRENLWYLLTAAPALAGVKRWLRGG